LAGRAATVALAPSDIAAGAGARFLSALPSAVTFLVSCRIDVYKYSVSVAFGCIGLALIG
jgi:hypothetical protein